MTFLRRAATVLLAGLAAVSLASCGSSGKSGNAVPSLEQVRAVLVRHTQAVLAHSSAAFLTDVDPATQASAFRARQAAEIDALSTVPLASWTYSVDADVTDAAATAVATKRYGVAARIVKVAVAYRLSGIDETGSVHDVWWTFLRRSGRTVIAGDDDLAASGGTSWRGPWDFGPITTARAASTLVLGHPDSAPSLPGIAATTAAAIPVVSGVVGSAWPQRVAVFVPSTDAEFQALTGGVSSTDVAAVTVYDDPGAEQVARIVVRPKVLTTLSGVGLQIVLRHEVTHLATAATTTPITPRWLIEGLAEYVGNLDSGQPVTTAAAELASTVRAGTLPAALPRDTDFATTGAAGDRVYEESWLACRFIASRVGPKGLADLYTAVGQSSAPNDSAFGVVLQQRLGMSLATFVAGWRAYLKAELG